jgi:hypothetical protein
LRNIFFVKHRIEASQMKSLQRDFISGQKQAIDGNSLKALLTWKKFVSVYTPFIQELPRFSYNMAINQVTSNDVYSCLRPSKAAAYRKISEFSNGRNQILRESSTFMGYLGRRNHPQG